VDDPGLLWAAALRVRQAIYMTRASPQYVLPVEHSSKKNEATVFEPAAPSRAWRGTVDSRAVLRRLEALRQLEVVLRDALHPGEAKPQVGSRWRHREVGASLGWGATELRQNSAASLLQVMKRFNEFIQSIY